MVTVLVTSFLLLTVISYAIYRWQRPSSNENAERALTPPPTGVRSLFSDERGDAALAARLKEAEAGKLASELRARLLERASGGDKAVLAEAHATKNSSLYDEVLSALVICAGDDYKQLFALVSHITRSSSSNERLRVSRGLAERFIEAWRAVSPDRRGVALLLHVAARADEADVYQRAVETAYEMWRNSLLQDVSAVELRALFDGEYWMLSANTRGGGAGFVLKRRLAKLRHELTRASPKTNA